MLDALEELCDASRLLGVTLALFGGDPSFVTAVALRFESRAAVFRAVEDDDTLALHIGRLELAEGESAADASGATPWAGCVGRSLSWAWQMINQQGYTDGVRLEFNPPDAPVIAELVVAASAIRVFVASESATPECGGSGGRAAGVKGGIMPLYLVTCVCDEGVRESLFKVIEAESRLEIARAIHRDPGPWMRWLEWSKVWRPSYEEQNCPTPEVLLQRIDASRIDGDSEWAFRIHEIKTVERLTPSA